MEHNGIDPIIHGVGVDHCGGNSVAGMDSLLRHAPDAAAPIIHTPSLFRDNSHDCRCHGGGFRCWGRHSCTVVGLLRELLAVNTRFHGTAQPSWSDATACVNEKLCEACSLGQGASVTLHDHTALS